VTYRDGDGAVDEIDAASAEDQPGLEGWPTSIGGFASNLLAARLQMVISLGFTSSSRWSELLCLATVLQSLARPRPRGGRLADEAGAACSSIAVISAPQ